jgi:hypothetical protein
MRRFALALGIVATVVALIALPTAIAANPEVVHFDFSDSFPDDNFCGTGMRINITVEGHGTEFLAPNGNRDYWNRVVGNTTFTNPLTGDTVIQHFANGFIARIIAGDPETGNWVEEGTFTGLPERLRLAHGGVLSRDAGIATFRNTFVDGELVSSELIAVKGPHPNAESDFELFCEVMIPALGLD